MREPWPALDRSATGKKKSRHYIYQDLGLSSV